MIKRHKPKPLSIFTRLKLAMYGIGFVIKTQRHMKVHSVAAILAIVLGIALKLPPTEMVLLCLTITVVLVAEAINTAIEITVDIATRKARLRAKLSKDIAAGAVLLASLNALVVAYLLFAHRLFNLILGGHS